MDGTEHFAVNSKNVELTISDLWRWAYSDLLNNISMGVLAEFIVKSSFACTPPKDPRPRADWASCGIISPSGRRIEVKSAAYLQSWSSDYFSQVIYDIAPRRTWTPEAKCSPERIRRSDLYVFCLYTARSRGQSILNLDLWKFFVLPTSVLDRELPEQKTMFFSTLLGLEPVEADFSTLGDIIESIAL